MSKRRLLAKYKHTPTPTRLSGLVWYPLAQLQVQGLAGSYGITRDGAACIVAVLSPNQSWKQNIKTADRFLASTVSDPGAPCLALAAFPPNVVKARAIRRDPGLCWSIIRGPKVIAFARALSGDLSDPVIDRWALASYFGKPLEAWPSAGVCRRVSHDYISAAEAIGLLPAEFQAILWIRERGSA